MLQTKILELLPVLHIASVQNNLMELIQSKNLKIVYFITLHVMYLKINIFRLFAQAKVYSALIFGMYSLIFS